MVFRRRLDDGRVFFNPNYEPANDEYKPGKVTSYVREGRIKPNTIWHANSKRKCYGTNCPICYQRVFCTGQAGLMRK